MSSSNHEPLFVSGHLLQLAEQACKLRLAKSPDNPAAVRALAQVYRKQGKLEEALPLYRRLTALDADDREAAYMHAVLAGTEVPVLKGMRPAPFVFVKNFLPPSYHDHLLPFMVSIRELLVPALVGDNKYNPDARESLDLPGPWDLKRCFREQVRKIIPGVAPRLHVEPFEIGELEVKVRCYMDGHFFRAHMDCRADSPSVANRRISYVYFFHKTPRPYTGGNLLLFDTEIETNRFTTASFTSVVPEHNSIVFFPSPYWHCVVPIRCPSKDFSDSRFAINGHVNKAAPMPAAEAAAPVTTDQGAVPALAGLP